MNAETTKFKTKSGLEFREQWEARAYDAIEKTIKTMKDLDPPLFAASFDSDCEAINEVRQTMRETIQRLRTIRDTVIYPLSR